VVDNATPYDIAQVVRSIYQRGSWFRRQMQYWRPYICPFHELVSLVSDKSTVLDVGCGDGLFLNLLASQGKVRYGLGFDANSSAIKLAKSAAENMNTVSDIEFIHLSVGAPWPEKQFDVVSMIDVLHHIPPKQKKHAIHMAMSHVKPGGLFIYKDIGIRPQWRAWANRIHDLILAREWITYTSADKLISWATEDGLKEDKRATYNMLWYGHELLVFRK